MKIPIKLIAGFVIVFLVGIDVGLIAAPFILFGGNGHFPAGGSTETSSSPTGNAFSTSQYSVYSYLISNGGLANLSASGSAALGDVNITTDQLQNGSTQYIMKFKGASTPYDVTINQTEKLYFLDSSLGDDHGDTDSSYGDDGYLVVNLAGNIVSMRYPLPGS